MSAKNLWNDKSLLRDAMGRFPTGVAIVTTCSDNGAPVGMTINSFSSLSLSPPLITWCIDRKATSYQVFARAETFAITILAHDQSEFAARFATRGEDKFRGIEIAGLEAPPVPGGCAWFRCSTYRSYLLGDHRMLVGQITVCGRNTKQPLVFHNGKFQQIRMPEASVAA